ncbi:hypothetical protein HDV05_001840 [Chytridiales sp. JEL 0842]|nr:hypothetical protein HDV05_001840 [Chytridiales sp. JEL 0842]
MSSSRRRRLDSMELDEDYNPRDEHQDDLGIDDAGDNFSIDFDIDMDLDVDIPGSHEEVPIGDQSFSTSANGSKTNSLHASEDESFDADIMGDESPSPTDTGLGGRRPLRICKKELRDKNRAMYQVEWSDGTRSWEKCDEDTEDTLAELILDYDMGSSYASYPTSTRSTRESRRVSVSRDSVSAADSDTSYTNKSKSKKESNGSNSGSVTGKQSNHKKKGNGSGNGRKKLAPKMSLHHQVCDKCGMRDGSKQKRNADSDFVGQIGSLKKCVTCSNSIHEECITKLSKKEKEVAERLAASGPYSIEGFQCSYCTQTPMPKCMLCSNYPDLPSVDSDVSTPPDSPSPPSSINGIDKPENNNSTSEVKEKKKIAFGQIDPLFRCNRCHMSAHISCLENQFHNLWEYPDDIDKANGLYFGTEQHYRKVWRCNECLIWPEDVEVVLTYRDIPLKEGELYFDTQFKAPPGSRREYYVKLQDISYRYCNWVPARWLNGTKGGSQRVAKFHADNPKPKKPLEVVLESYLRVDKILDVKYRQKNDPSIKELQNILSKEDIELGVHQIESVLVKWTELPYTASTWEQIPDVFSDVDLNESDDVDAALRSRIDHEMRPSFVDGLKAYWKREDIPTNYSKINPNARPKFKEHQSQPNYLVNGVLKDYQMEGLNWLVYKWTRGVPSILADEMGLGKTVQMVSFVSVLFHDFGRYPFLIVAPSITIGHWLNEFMKWSPDMVVLHYTGTKQDKEFIRRYELFENNKSSRGRRLKCHVLIMNYETVMNEGQQFKDVQFEALICDEGHRLKNDDAKTFKSLSNNISTRHKVVLTGTPLQNNLRELFNLMHFLHPEKWIDPKTTALEYDNIDDAKVLKIHEILRPHFLRRTKELVLKLPPSAELLVPVSLTRLQRELYTSVLERNYSVLRSIGVHDGTQPGRAAPLQNILMELRKICDHPYLIDDIEPRNLPSEEARRLLLEGGSKLQLLNLLLPKLKAGNHRTLIFSQFQIALNILEDFLMDEGYSYLRIDGTTPVGVRQALLDKYNAPDSPYFIFLLTTRTGGTGINLVSADTIIMYDADFNPHQDIQAMARVHRIGQEKPVVVYKLFTRGTIEEKIIDSAKRKLVLDHLIVKKMDDDNINTQELSEVIKFGAKSLFDEKDESNQAIKYTEAMIDKLLDRSELIEEADKEKSEAKRAAEKEGALNFSFAQVWTQEEQVETDFSFLADASSSAKEPTQNKTAAVVVADDPATVEQDAEYWDKVLKARIEQAERERELEEQRKLDGRRSRKVVNYSENRRNRKRLANVEESHDSDAVYEPGEESGKDSVDNSEGEEVQSLEGPPAAKRPRLNSMPTNDSYLDAVQHSRLPIKAPLTIDDAQNSPTNSTPILSVGGLVEYHPGDKFHNLEPLVLENYAGHTFCWLCGNPRCRLRSRCLRARDISYLRSYRYSLDKSDPHNELKFLVLERLIQKVKNVIRNNRILNRTSLASASNDSLQTVTDSLAPPITPTQGLNMPHQYPSSNLSVNRPPTTLSQGEQHAVHVPMGNNSILKSQQAIVSPSITSLSAPASRPSNPITAPTTGVNSINPTQHPQNPQQTASGKPKPPVSASNPTQAKFDDALKQLVSAGQDRRTQAASGVLTNDMKHMNGSMAQQISAAIQIYSNPANLAQGVNQLLGVPGGNLPMTSANSSFTLPKNSNSAPSQTLNELHNKQVSNRPTALTQGAESLQHPSSLLPQPSPSQSVANLVQHFSQVSKQPVQSHTTTNAKHLETPIQPTNLPQNPLQPPIPQQAQPGLKATQPAPGAQGTGESSNLFCFCCSEDGHESIKCPRLASDPETCKVTLGTFLEYNQITKDEYDRLFIIAERCAMIRAHVLKERAKEKALKRLSGGLNK